jgi:hypothetical protein
MLAGVGMESPSCSTSHQCDTLHTPECVLKSPSLGWGSASACATTATRLGRFACLATVCIAATIHPLAHASHCGQLGGEITGSWLVQQKKRRCCRSVVLRGIQLRRKPLIVRDESKNCGWRKVCVRSCREGGSRCKLQE